MNRIYYFAALAAVAGVMTSCSSNDDVAGNGTSQEIQSANLGIDVKIASEVTSRAATEHAKTWTNGDKIGVSLVVSLTATSGGDYTIYSKPGESSANTATYQNIPWTATVSESTTWSGAPMPLFNTGAQVTAYYPYNTDGGTTAVDPKAIEMKTTDNIDWMYATATKGTNSNDLTAYNTTASLTMNHAQAEITFVINNGNVNSGKTAKENLYTGEGKITYLKISSSQFTSDGKLNSMTGAIEQMTGSSTTVIENGTSTGTEQKYSIKEDASPTGTTLKTATESWFVSPLAEETNATVDFELMIDSQKYTISNVAVKNSSDNACPIKRGNRYKFTLTLSDANLSISSVEITPWADAGTGTGTLDPTNN